VIFGCPFGERTAYLLAGAFHYRDAMLDDHPPLEKSKKWFLLKNIVLISRILVIIAIFGLLLTSVVVIVTGFAELFRILSYFMEHGLLNEGVGTFLAVTVTEMIDLYLIGLVLLIIAVGLYQLFIDPNLDVPEWLDTPSFEVLKGRLLVVVVVVLAVMFLGYAAEATDAIFIAGMGIAISLVIAACGYIISIHAQANIEKKRLEIQGTSSQGTDQDQ
jgi:uncharacterized membrane protein YqhA